MSDQIVIHHPETQEPLPVKTRYMGLVTLERIPPCQHCKSGHMMALADYVQHGFGMDTHQLACFCQNCAHGTVFVYLVEVG